MVSQDMERLVENADRILVLAEGRLLLDGTPADICRHPAVLQRAGIRIPQVTEFAISLLSRLNPWPGNGNIPLSIAEAAALLRELLPEGTGAS